MGAETEDAERQHKSLTCWGSDYDARAERHIAGKQWKYGYFLGPGGYGLHWEMSIQNRVRYGGEFDCWKRRLQVGRDLDHIRKPTGISEYTQPAHNSPPLLVRCRME
jgi:hypothetical protein